MFKSKNTNRILCIMLSLIMVFSIIPATAFADDSTNGLTITGDNGYTYTDGVLNITEAGDYTIENSDYAYETNDKVAMTTDIVVISAPSGEVNLTIAGVNIDVRDIENAAAIEITGECATNIILLDHTINLMWGGENKACIANNEHALTITCEHAEEDGHVCSDACGMLDVTGGNWGAGIGGNDESDGSNITISGGNIIANGSGQGAGIGGGWKGDGTNITIYGGNITARGAYNGAGIGGGSGKRGANITISGGTVIATGGENGAGIGGGNGGQGADFTISGGSVTTTGGGSGAGIGGGNNSKGSNITISGGTVTAKSNRYGAGIGGGGWGDGTDITISGGVVTATSGGSGAGIGGGTWSNGINITISGGTVTATGYEGAQSIGRGYNGDAASNIKVIPKTDMQIAVTADDTALYGSPFTTETDITDLISSVKTLILQEEAKQETVPEPEPETNDLIITGDTGYIYTDGVLHIFEAGDYTIENCVRTTIDTIVISATNGKVNITLNGVDIRTIRDSAAFEIIGECETNIILADNSVNTLKSGEHKAGISNNEHALTITCAHADEDGHTCSETCGTLNTTGGYYGAGIGGSYGVSSKNISTNSIAVVSNAPDKLSIDDVSDKPGETVTAARAFDDVAPPVHSHDFSGAWLSDSNGHWKMCEECGEKGNLGPHEYDNDYDATCNVCGYKREVSSIEDYEISEHGTNITISGGNVIATGGTNGAGIGGGYRGDSTNIIISGGNVTATGGRFGAGIGGGYLGDGKNIIVSSGTVIATGVESGDGIGGGYLGSAGNILVSPTAGNQIVVIADGIELDDYPFTEETDITDYISGAINVTLQSGAQQDSNPRINGLIVTGDTGYTYTSGVLNITDAGNYTIENRDKTTATKDAIAISAPSGEVNITLNGVNIDTSVVTNKAAIEITGECTTNIILADESINTLKSGQYKAGLTNNEYILTITCEYADEDGHVCSDTCGTLDVTGGEYGAGIGGSYIIGDYISYGHGSNITILGGTIIATGGGHGAGIGGGSRGKGSNISIFGGTVTATGGDSGAGIGGGSEAGAENITINGGKVTANGGDGAAGIGSSWNCSAKNITISGGIVSANGGGNAAGIGGGAVWGCGIDITISGGFVIAYGGSGGAGIGGGVQYGDGENIIISGGTVIARGGNSAAGIGGGGFEGGSGKDITISGGTVITTGGKNGAGIGGGEYGNGADITISGGTVNVTGGENAPSIGCGYDGGTASNIKVSPSADTQIAVTADDTALDGSPFTTETDITNLISGVKTITTKAEAIQNPVPDPEPELNYLIITGGTGYTYENDVLNITEAGDYTIKNLYKTIATIDTIVVSAPSGKVNITLDGVNIDVSGIDNRAAIEITGECATNIILADDTVNTLLSGENKAGLANNKHTLTISCSHADEDGHICAESCGTLNATGGKAGAGIGGDRQSDGANITISGGNITATATSTKENEDHYGGGAGIGGGSCVNEGIVGGDGINITITGGNIVANGANSGAGIGGGYQADGEKITISGGTITANGGSGAAGIGGGSIWGYGIDITISGGFVTANGGAAGIGGGVHGDGKNITISDGTVIAKGSNGCAGIGGGSVEFGDGTNITISGGAVIATGGENGAGIGGGDYGQGADITISGGTVTATGGENAMSIGSGRDGTASNIKVSPSADTQIAVTADDTALDGSPFIMETDITTLLSDVKKVIFETVENTELKDLIITGDSGYTYENDVLNITEAGDYTIKNLYKTIATTDTIVVSAPSGKVNITLDGVNIDVGDSKDKAAIEIIDECTTNVILADESVNTLISGLSKAGIANNEHILNINCAHANEKGHTCSETCGTLKTTGGRFGAGIGGNVISNDSNAPARFRISDASGEPGETITINVEIYDNKGLNGGKITLLSDAFTVTDIVPGSWITPLNGTMMLDNVATGIFDWYSANTFNTESGIYAVYTVKINEDAVPGTYDMTLLAEQLTDGDDELKEVDGVPFTATLTVEGEVPPVHEHDFSSEWKYDATNHWQECKEDGEIVHKAAHKYYDNQDATCEVCGYVRIISESSEHGTNITISGGNIIATGGDYAAGIGGGYDGSGTNITINGGNITAIAGHYAAGIGGGYQGNASNITIMDGDITATGSEYAAGIGGGRNGSAFDIAIFGGNIAATGGDYGAGIGGGSGSSGTDITVFGGIVNANGGDYAAGIGGGAGWFGVGKNITISGGTVTAISGTNAAAIGGGSGGETSGIKVSPAEIMQITATTGGEPLDGSPFTTETDISDLMSGVSSIILNEEFKPELKDLIITGDTGYTYTDDVLNITEAGDYTIRNLYKNIATSNTIVVSAPSGEVNITLDGVNIDVSEINNVAAFEITGECTTNITLADNSINTLLSGENKAGLANNEHALTINCAHAGEDGHICTDTCGTLNVTGGYHSAGIGGNFISDSTNTINFDNYINNNSPIKFMIDNVSGKPGETIQIPISIYNNIGIMACDVSLSCDQFTVTDISKGSWGTTGEMITNTANKACTWYALNGVTTPSGVFAVYTVTINENAVPGAYTIILTYEEIVDLDFNEFDGETVIATLTVEGEGFEGSKHGANITITGGNITATGGTFGAAGIGGSEYGNGTNITISGGNVTANGSRCGSGIGGGYGGNGEKITITDGNVTADGGHSGAGIGGGYQGDGTNIMITGGTVTANGGEFSAGIGGGNMGHGSNITISGGDVTATGGSNTYSGGAGIGGGHDGNGTNITILDGDVTATGGYHGAGIGSGGSSTSVSSSGKASNITIIGGNVTATGGEDAPSIGSGYEGDAASNIKVSPAANSEIAATAEGTPLDGSPFTKEIDITELVSSVKSVIFKTENYGSNVIKNATTGALYESISDAIADAASGDVVKLVGDCSVSHLMIPEGVTLDMNGKMLEITGRMFASYGNIVDETGNGEGGLKIGVNDFIHLQADNTSLPIYDTANGCYRLFNYEMATRGVNSGSDDTAKYGFTLYFDSVEAYKLLINSEETNLDMTVNLSWTGMGNEISYTVPDATLVQFAATAVKQMEANGKVTAAITFTVKGLDNLAIGTEVWADSTIESATDVSMTGTKCTYTKP